MGLSETIREIESWFKVDRGPPGLPVSYTDQGGKVVGDGPVDMECAPNGEVYVLLTSGGEVEAGRKVSLWFADESRAANHFGFAVEDYAETVAPRDQWGSLYLYWRDLPRFESASYIAIDQAGLLQRQSLLAAHFNLELGYVWARLLISKTGAAGKEEK